MLTVEIEGDRGDEFERAIRMRERVQLDEAAEHVGIVWNGDVWAVGASGRGRDRNRRENGSGVGVMARSCGRNRRLKTSCDVIRRARTNAAQDNAGAMSEGAGRPVEQWGS